MSAKSDGEVYKILNNGGWTVGIVITAGGVLFVVAILMWLFYVGFRELAIVTTL